MHQQSNGVLISGKTVSDYCMVLFQLSSRIGERKCQSRRPVFQPIATEQSQEFASPTRQERHTGPPNRDQ
jgi:hypothetical protein